MKNKQTAYQMEMLLRSMKGPEWDPSAIKVYSFVLKDVPDDVVIQAVEHCLRHCDWRPSGAEILQECERILESRSRRERVQQWLDQHPEWRELLQQAREERGPQCSPDETAARLRALRRGVLALSSKALPPGPTEEVEPDA